MISVRWGGIRELAQAVGPETRWKVGMQVRAALASMEQGMRTAREADLIMRAFGKTEKQRELTTDRIMAKALGIPLWRLRGSRLQGELTR